MKPNCLIISFIAITFAIIDNKSFIKSPSKEYGFLSSNIKDRLLYHYKVIDLAVLDKLKTDYSCELGGTYCQISLNIDTAKVTRSGLHNEIMEFNFNPAEVKTLGDGFQFIWENN